MKKLRVLMCMILMSMVFQTSFALPIVLKKSTTRQHGGSRTSSPALVADLNDHKIELSVNRYVGTIHIYVYDADNTCVLYDVVQVSGKNLIALDLSYFKNAQYSMELILDDEAIYKGEFEL